MEQAILCDSEFPVRRGMQAAGRWSLLGGFYTEPLFGALPLNSFLRMISRLPGVASNSLSVATGLASPGLGEHMANEPRKQRGTWA